MTPELSDAALVVLRVGYLGGFLGSFAFLALWEGGRPLAAPPATRARHFARNLVLFAVTVALVQALVWGWMPQDSTGFAAIPAGPLTPLGLPALALVVAGFVVADLVEYLFHRLCHRWRWLWLVHAVHHSDPDLDVTTALRFHPLEIVLVTVLKLSVFLLLGIPLWVEMARAVLLNPWSFVQHANVGYPAWLERRLRWLVVTPAMHRLHHSPVEVETNSNFGTVLSVWDYLFRTFRRPQGERPPRYGLLRLTAESWQTVRGMLETPIRARNIGTL